MALALPSRIPGVYLEETFRRPAPALETGIPAFLGRLSAQGLGLPLFAEALLVTAIDRTAWSALEASVGTAWAEGPLGFAVRGFFENGGLRCYVVNLAKRSLDPTVTEALDALGGFDLVCAPDLGALGANGQERLVQLFSGRHRYFLILDAPRDGWEVAEVPAPLRSPDAALYMPWIKVRGACGTCTGTGMENRKSCSLCGGSGQGFIPPSGHVAGLYARTDRQSGVHKAPANEVLEGVFDLALRLDERSLAQLNTRGVNCLRALPGRGIRVWGARTLSPQDPGFAFVNARRVFLTVARWLESALADIVFEPNNLRLWVRITREVSTFLEDLYRRGALMGASAAEAFYVKCDAETNPPKTREDGSVVAEVGLALTRPAEFITLRLVSGTSGSSATGVARGP